MAKKSIFTFEELRLITDAFYESEKHGSSDWVKYVLSTPAGSGAYDKYFFNLTERTQEYFEEMADVAVKDCLSDYGITYRVLRIFCEQLFSMLNKLILCVKRHSSTVWSIL